MARDKVCRNRNKKFLPLLLEFIDFGHKEKIYENSGCKGSFAAPLRSAGKTESPYCLHYPKKKEGTNLDADWFAFFSFC